jgi:hypothetical protein
VNSALVSQESKENIFIKTGIRIVITRTFSDFSEISRGVTMGHFALEGISEG